MELAHYGYLLHTQCAVTLFQMRRVWSPLRLEVQHLKQALVNGRCSSHQLETWALISLIDHWIYVWTRQTCLPT